MWLKQIKTTKHTFFKLYFGLGLGLANPSQKSNTTDDKKLQALMPHKESSMCLTVPLVVLPLSSLQSGSTAKKPIFKSSKC